MQYIYVKDFEDLFSRSAKYCDTVLLWHQSNNNSVAPNSDDYAATNIILFMVLNVQLRRKTEGRILQSISFRDFFSKTNQMNKISNLFYFGTTLHMFQCCMYGLRLLMTDGETVRNM